MPGQVQTDELIFNKSLGRGKRGKDVRRIQEWLCLNGYGVVVDGQFGPATEAAIKAIRRERGWPGKGPVDEAAFARLSAPMRRALTTPKKVRRKLGAAVVEIAHRHLAAHPREVGGQNLGPWVRLYMDGKQGTHYPWCIGFAWFVIRQACEALNIEMPFAKTYSCDRLAADGRKKELMIREAEVGRSDPAELLPPGTVFLQRRKPGDWIHAGLVVRANRETFETIEGNTNDEGSREGYEVCRRIRGYKDKDFVLLRREPSPSHEAGKGNRLTAAFVGTTGRPNPGLGAARSRIATTGGLGVHLIALLTFFSVLCGSQAFAVDLMQKQLTETDLKGKTCEQLRIMRNEIFARHGREFGDPKLREYFLKQKWYSPQYEPTNFPSEELITALQYKNIKYIEHIEGKKECRNPKRVFDFNQWGIVEWSAAFAALATILTIFRMIYRFLVGRRRAEAAPPE